MSAWTARRLGVADVLTLANALCGVAAILVAGGAAEVPALAPSQRYEAAAMFLLFGTLFDVLDGAAARRWGGTLLGGSLDSLADAISFGIAPVVAVIAYLSSDALTAERVVLIAAGLAYAAAALVRLAGFMTEQHDDLTFVGLPTTSACIAAVYLGFLSPPPLLAAVGLVVLALLMVSPLAYPTGHRVYALCIAGWVLGFVAIIGLVDVRIAAMLSILAIVVVVPLVNRLRTHVASEPAA